MFGSSMAPSLDQDREYDSSTARDLKLAELVSSIERITVRRSDVNAPKGGWPSISAIAASAFVLERGLRAQRGRGASEGDGRSHDDVIALR